MSHPPYWIIKQFFYPIGNTPAISLTQDLSPEQPADILLLGCGDARNILFTLYADLMIGSSVRRIDITCCDIQPAVLARNALLFSLLESNEDIDTIWNIYYHFKIDNRAMEMLTRHSQQLCDCAQTIESWRSSRYGSFLKLVDTRTLVDLCRYWKNYAGFANLPAHRLKRLLEEQSILSESILDQYNFNIIPGRSAGMLWPEAAAPAAELFQKYWETGTTFTSTRDIRLATNLNPTFIYSLSGEVFDPHYGTFPSGFHLMPAFAPITADPAGPLPSRGPAIINVSKQQFKAWCKSYHATRAANSINIRLYSGEALAFCHALNKVAQTGQPSTDIPISPWRAPQINLDELHASLPHHAPITFDVIDTSNLTDHVGLLNLLIATQPLLKKNPESQSILYTETMLPAGEDVTQSFLARIGADVPTISSLLGLAPRPYVSAFTTQSNLHELLMSEYSSQFHERVAWVDPSGGDHHACTNHPTSAFEVDDLASVLYGVYDNMLFNEKITPAIFHDPQIAALMSSRKIHYQRETIALLFRAVKNRVRILHGSWEQVADIFLKLTITDQSRIIASNNYQDLCVQLHRYGIYTVPPLKPDWHARFRPSPRAGIFDYWPNPPPVVCVVLTVPRKNMQMFFADPESVMNPTLRCSLRVEGSHDNIYSAIHLVWGRCSPLPGSNKVVLQEDTQGMKGSSGLVVSFWAGSWVLEIPNTLVSLCVDHTSNTNASFTRRLGLRGDVFTTRITNKQHVRLLAYRPALVSEVSQTQSNQIGSPSISTSNDYCQVIPDKESGGCSVNSLSRRVDVQSAAEQESLLNGAKVSATQIASCTMELAIGQYRHKVSYPYPIRGTSHKLRVARKSHYVELIVPVSKPLDQGGYSLCPFPVLLRNAYTPWNVHHLHLDRLPIFDTRISTRAQWLNIHCALQLSDWERVIMEDGDPENYSAAKALVSVKESIHAMMINISGVEGQRTRAIAFLEPGNKDMYMILLVGSIRLDLASSTVVADTAVITLSKVRMSDLLPGIQKLDRAQSLGQIATTVHEVAAWKKLLPAYVERCRVWEHKPNCEYTSYGAIPISLEIDENPICTCGQGIGFTSPEWKVSEWKDLLPFATRAAISPIFSVSYLEHGEEMTRDRASPASNSASKQSNARNKHNTACLACGGPGQPNLSACSRCKKARYCSAACQRQDWKEHKEECQSA